MNKNSTNILRFPEVLKRVGMKRTTIYNWVAEGKFPPPVKLGVRSVGWTEQSVELWIKNRISESHVG
jgi:prophage regulatory protein